MQAYRFFTDDLLACATRVARDRLYNGAAIDGSSRLGLRLCLGLCSADTACAVRAARRALGLGGRSVGAAFCRARHTIPTVAHTTAANEGDAVVRTGVVAVSVVPVSASIDVVYLGTSVVVIVTTVVGENGEIEAV